MGTINTIMDFVTHFIFNWTTYFWSIPIWFVIWMIFIKLMEKKVLVGDLLPLAFASLLNPLWYVILFGLIILLPIAILVIYISEFYWDKIRDKKIF